MGHPGTVPSPPPKKSREARETLMANWKFFTRLHCAVYRGTLGLVGGNLIGIQMLLLTTKGRKTGKERTLPLAYVEDAGEYIVVASNGGATRPPAWWFNLSEQTTAHIQVRGERFEVSWDLAPQDRRMEYWRKLQAAVPAYRMYRHRTDREIPIVRLKRQVRIPTQAEANPTWQTRDLTPASAPSGSAATAQHPAQLVNTSTGS